MNNSLLISVIIPLYNTEKFIEKCINSFLSYKSNDFEIIVIDDGSNDNSLKICENIKMKDRRLKVINIQNSGASTARNIGIKKSIGKYIFFCDSDDYIDTNEFEKVLNKIKNQDSDLYIFNKCNEGTTGGEYIKDEIGMKNGYTEDMNETYKYALKIRISAPWKKIFKSSLLKKNKVYFPKERIIHEDLSQFLNYLMFCKNVYVLDENMYYHRYTENSLSKQIKFKMFNDIVYSYNMMENLVEKKKIDTKYLNTAKNRYLAIVMGIIARMKRNRIPDSEIKKNIRKSNLNYVFRNIRLIGKINYIRYFFYITKSFKIYYFLYRKRKERNDKKI